MFYMSALDQTSPCYTFCSTGHHTGTKGNHMKITASYGTIVGIKELLHLTYLSGQTLHCTIRQYDDYFRKSLKNYLKSHFISPVIFFKVFF